MFSGVRQHSLFYVLDKNNLTLEIGDVESVSNPTTKNNQNTFTTQPPFYAQETFVDIRVKVGETISEFKQLPSNANIATFGNVIVSDSKDSMIYEIETMQRNSKNVIESISYHEKVLQACDNMLKEINPHFAKEKLQEEKIEALEGKMNGMEDTLNKMYGMLSNVLENKPKKNKED
jgi:hypothetical protein